jgi:hypothetical protein
MAKRMQRHQCRGYYSFLEHIAIVHKPWTFLHVVLILPVFLVVATPKKVASYGLVFCASAGFSVTVTRTRATPCSTNPMLLAAAFDKSIMRRLGLAYGPRSVILTSVFSPVSMFSTMTLVPQGNLRWAAVMSPGENRSPLAVFLP